MSSTQLRAAIVNARTARAVYISEGLTDAAQAARRLERSLQRQLDALTGGGKVRAA